MKYEIPEMVKRQRAAIVNNGSVVGLVGSGVAVGSVATKHGVSGLTKAAVLEYAIRGIRVNAVALGMVRTPLAERMVNSLPPGAEQAMLSVVPQGRWCEPDEVAEVVVFLCSDAASHGPFTCWTAIVGLIDVTLNRCVLLCRRTSDSGHTRGPILPKASAKSVPVFRPRVAHSPPAVGPRPTFLTGRHRRGAWLPTHSRSVIIEGVG